MRPRERPLQSPNTPYVSRGFLDTALGAPAASARSSHARVAGAGTPAPPRWGAAARRALPGRCPRLSSPPASSGHPGRPVRCPCPLLLLRPSAELSRAPGRVGFPSKRAPAARSPGPRCRSHRSCPCLRRGQLLRRRSQAAGAGAARGPRAAAAAPCRPPFSLDRRERQQSRARSTGALAHFPAPATTPGRLLGRSLRPAPPTGRSAAPVPV